MGYGGFSIGFRLRAGVKPRTERTLDYIKGELRELRYRFLSGKLRQPPWWSIAVASLDEEVCYTSAEWASGEEEGRRIRVYWMVYSDWSYEVIEHWNDLFVAARWTAIADLLRRCGFEPEADPPALDPLLDRRPKHVFPVLTSGLHVVAEGDLDDVDSIGVFRVEGPDKMLRWDSFDEADRRTLTQAMESDRCGCRLCVLLRAARDRAHAGTPPPKASLSRAHEVSAAMLEHLDRLAAQPEDDALRLGFAAWLKTIGEARWAELIELETKGARAAIDPKQAARAARLRTAFAGDVLGPLARSITACRFERGLLVSCDFRPVSRLDAPASIGDPRWRSVQEIGWNRRWHAGAPFDLVAHPVMRGLRRLTCMFDVGLRLLLDSEPRPLERLDVLAWPTAPLSEDVRTQLREAPGLPNLRALRIVFVFSGTPDVEAFEWIWSGRLGSSLDEVEVRYFGMQRALVFAGIRRGLNRRRAREPSVRAPRVVDQNQRAIVEQGPDGWFRTPRSLRPLSEVLPVALEAERTKYGALPAPAEELIARARLEAGDVTFAAVSIVDGPSGPRLVRWHELLADLAREGRTSGATTAAALLDEHGAARADAQRVSRQIAANLVELIARVDDRLDAPPSRFSEPELRCRYRSPEAEVIEADDAVLVARGFFASVKKWRAIFDAERPARAEVWFARAFVELFDASVDAEARRRAASSSFAASLALGGRRAARWLAALSANEAEAVAPAPSASPLVMFRSAYRGGDPAGIVAAARLVPKVRSTASKERLTAAELANALSDITTHGDASLIAAMVEEVGRLAPPSPRRSSKSRGPEAVGRKHLAYNLACALAQLGRLDEALEHLAVNLAAGDDPWDAWFDRDFEPLWSDPRFVELLGRHGARGPAPPDLGAAIRRALQTRSIPVAERAIRAAIATAQMLASNDIERLLNGVLQWGSKRDLEAAWRVMGELEEARDALDEPTAARSALLARLAEQIGDRASALVHVANALEGGATHILAAAELDRLVRSPEFAAWCAQHHNKVAP